MAKPFIPHLIYYVKQNKVNSKNLDVAMPLPDLHGGACPMKAIYEKLDYCPKEEHNDDQPAPTKIEFSVFPLPKSNIYSVFICHSLTKHNINYLDYFHAPELINDIFHPPKSFLIFS